MSRGLTTVGSLSADLSKIYRAVVRHTPEIELNGKKLRTNKYKGGKLCGLDHSGIRYLQQNPDTSSEWGQRAKAGADIVWIIEIETGEYLGVIEDRQLSTYKWKVDAFKAKRKAKENEVV